MKQSLRCNIILPIELAECQLSLQEIGAIFVLYSLKTIDINTQSYWATDDIMIATGQSLTERGILKFSKNDNSENIMEIDLTGVVSMKKEFWEFCDYDDDGNEIWGHMDYGYGVTSFRFKARPKLYKGKIVWELYDSDDATYHCPFESLEDCELAVRDKLKIEFEQLKELYSNE
jgi:hypothetical protein